MTQMTDAQGPQLAPYITHSISSCHVFHTVLLLFKFSINF